MVNFIILITRIAALVIGGLTKNIYVTLVIWSVSGVVVYGGLALWLLKLSHVPWGSAFRTIFQYTLYATLPALFLVVFTRTISQFAILFLILTAAVSLIYYAIIITRDHDMRDYLLAQLPSRRIRAG